MFFFQDDIGYLIELKTIPFFQFLLTPWSVHFSPLTNFLTKIEFWLFGLNFTGYFIISLILHVLNLLLLGKIVKELAGRRFFVFLAVCFFLISLTFTEPFLWLVVQGMPLATFFLGWAFLFWYRFVTKKEVKNLFLSLGATVFASFSFGVGVGSGLVFAVVSLFFQKEKDKKRRVMTMALSLYAASGLMTYLAGPLIASHKLARVTPVTANLLKDILAYLAFVVAGVARGVVGRFFLPGFEPRHFEIVLSIVSFLPFIFLVIIFTWLIKNLKEKRDKIKLATLSIFVFYPYAWAGILRYQFGLKQALAERYAYPSLFFFVILLVLMVKHLFSFRLITSKKLLAVFAAVFVGLQSMMFVKNAIKFEERPFLTKKYFDDLRYVLVSSRIVLNLPLPSYINQEYTISDLSLVLTSSEIKFIDPLRAFCRNELKRSLEDKKILNFYKEQVEDPVVRKVLPKIILEKCINSTGDKI